MGDPSVSRYLADVEKRRARSRIVEKRETCFLTGLLQARTVYRLSTESLPIFNSPSILLYTEILDHRLHLERYSVQAATRH